MSIRPPFGRRSATMLLLAGLLAPPLFAAPKAPAGEECHLVRVTYQVADLIIPVPAVVHIAGGSASAHASGAAATGAGATAKTQEEDLIKLITSTVDPGSWCNKGGHGTIDYHPLTMSLVVCQTPDAQEQVVDLLNSLRRLQETEVSLEVRFVSADAAFVERMGLDGKDGAEVKSAAPSDAPLRVTFLKDEQVRRLMEAAQEDVKTNVMQTPKLTLFNGQTSVLDVNDPQEFVTGVDLRAAPNGNIIYMPHLEKIPVGLFMTAEPVVSADRRSVKVNLNVNLSSLDDPKADLIPIKLPPMPPGDDGEPAPTTQLVQHPRVTRLALDGAFTVPDGGTAVVTGWTRERQVRTESGPPVLSDIPYLNHLFKNVGYARRKECVLLMVTPRIIVPTEEEEKATGKTEEAPRIAVQPCAAPLCCKHQQAVELVEKYNQACADGRMAEATQLAVQALALDPACFHGDGQPPAVLQTSSPQR